MLATAGVAGTATFRGCYVGTAEDRAIDEHRAGSVQLIDMNEAGLRRRLIG
jgi:hypothetical protein